MAAKGSAGDLGSASHRGLSPLCPVASSKARPLSRKGPQQLLGSHHRPPPSEFSPYARAWLRPGEVAEPRVGLVVPYPEAHLHLHLLLTCNAE